jgi:cell fate (sporulation/competence/biofilm development) regulator YlbF (YheA/YmcA/DUF963 family)
MPRVDILAPMDPILEEARKLAEMLATDARFTTLRDLETSVLKEPETRRLLEDYEKSRLELEHKQQNMHPISPDEKHAHAEITKKVHAVPALLDLARAQADYAQMMDLVNRTIHERLRAGFEAAEG